MGAMIDKVRPVETPTLESDVTVKAQMAGDDRSIVVLGAGGRVAAMLRRIWATDGTERRIAAWTARRPGDADTLSWSPGAPATHVPRAHTVIAAWGVTSGTEAELAANTRLAHAAMDLADEIGAVRVLHFSSAAVYDGGEHRWDEADTPRPRSAYGAAKLAMEEAVLERCSAERTGCANCCLRLANVAGADQLFAAMTGDRVVTLDRFPDGAGPRRSYLAPTELAATLRALADLPPEALPSRLNVAGPGPVAMAEIVQAAGKPLVWRDAPETALPEMALATERLEALVGPLPRSADAAALAEEGTRWQGKAA